MKINTYAFREGMSCAKKIWYDAYDPDDFHKNEDTLMDYNRKSTKALARELFDKVYDIDWGTFEYRISDTQEMIEDKNPDLESEHFANAAFRYEDLDCVVDILTVYDDGLDINEIKAKKSCIKNKKLNKEILYELAFKYYVVTRAGYKVKKINLIYLNPDYKKDGETDPAQLFIIADVTDEVVKWCDEEGGIDNNIAGMRSILENSEEPGNMINSSCKNCKKRNKCMADLPQANIWNLRGYKGFDIHVLYNDGIVTLDQFLKNTDRLKRNSSLDKNVKIAKAHINEKMVFDKEKISAFLDDLSYPMAFLDFEYYHVAVPEFEGHAPYERIPFQYSLDVVNEKGALPVHYEFLADENTDPKREIAERLSEEIPENSCLVIYNKSTEPGILRALGDAFPDLSERLYAIADNFRDLKEIFEKVYCYKPEMEFSYSRKKVYPALCPGKDYSELSGVKEGEEAMDEFFRLRTMDPEEREKAREGLLEYCALDTSAMIDIIKALRELAAEEQDG